MRSPVRVARAVASFALVAALGAGTSACQRGTWVAVSSPHFEMKTDAAPSDAARWLESLEQSYDLLSGVMPPPFDGERAKEQIQVVLFARRDDYAAAAPRGAAAFFTEGSPTDLEPSPIAVLWEGTSETVALQHELTHYFLRHRLVHLPVWLNEGMAQYYSTMRLEDRGLLMGAYLPGYRFSADAEWSGKGIPIRAVPSVTELVGMSSEWFYAQQRSANAEPVEGEKLREIANYGGAWALVHMLEHSSLYRKRFHAYLNALSAGTRPEVAWANAFAGVDPQALEAELRQTLAEDVHHARVLPYTGHAGSGAPIERPLTPSEVHLVYARLFRREGDGVQVALRHLDAAMAGDPGSREVHYARGVYLLRQDDLAGAERDADAALSVDRSDPRALLLRTEIEIEKAHDGKGDEALLASLSDRLARRARTAAQRNVAAEGKSLTGHGEEAFPLAEEAVKRDPTCWRCLVTKARLLFERCRPADALAAQERAIELLPEGVRPVGIFRSHRLYYLAAGSPRPGPADPQPDAKRFLVMCAGKAALFTDKEQSLLDEADASGNADLARQACRNRQQRWATVAERCEGILEALKSR